MILRDKGYLSKLSTSLSNYLFVAIFFFFLIFIHQKYDIFEDLSLLILKCC